MIRRPPRSTRTDTLFPYTTLFRSLPHRAHRQVAPGLSADLRPAALGLRGILRPDVGRRRLLHALRFERPARPLVGRGGRSEEHTSELQSLMRISYAVFCLKKKNNHHVNNTYVDMPILLHYTM